MAKNKRRKLEPKSKNHDSIAKSKDSDKGSRPSKAQQTQPTIPFLPEARILLVGEGDFSFAKSIVEEHGCCDVTATCLDTRAELLDKYSPQSEEHVKYLEDEGQTVLYGIDATKLNQIKALKGQGDLFEVILFNFPHVGGKSKDVNRQVRFNQELLVKFFGSASLCLADTGTIVVTLFEGEPYTLWNIRDLARHSDLEVQRSFRFVASAYPGYSHSRTLGNVDGGGGWKGEDREARSYIFQKKDASKSKHSRNDSHKSTGEKRKRKEHGDSSDEGD